MAEDVPPERAGHGDCSAPGDPAPDDAVMLRLTTAYRHRSEDGSIVEVLRAMHPPAEEGPPAAAALRVGDWRVDPRTNRLLRGTQSLRIEPKAMDVLVFLARHAGEVVTRDELFAAVWRGVVVGDEALNQSIIKLRRALGDDSRSPTYIETIAKRGYRLVAPVVADADFEAAGRADVMPSASSSAAPQEDEPPRTFWRGAVGIASAAVLAVGASVLLFHDTADTPSARGDAERAQPWSREAPTRTLAVLPFEPSAGAREESYLARGIAEDLAADLSRMSGFRIVRSISGEGMPARYRVSGHVQRSGQTLRINVYVAETQTGAPLWSGRFERPFGDLFATQDEIVASIVQALPEKLSEIETQRTARRYTANVEAYDHFLRAQALFLVRGAEENQRARAAYLEALDLDPTFARAYAGLALTYALESRLHPGAGPAALERAFELAESARLMDPRIPQVHWTLGLLHTQARRHDDAVNALERAIRLDGSYADAYALLGGVHTYRGEPDRSISSIRTALRLNPEGGYLYFLLLGRAYLFRNDLDQALINLRAAAMRNPADIETHLYLAAALAASHDSAGAAWEVEEIRALQPTFSTSRWMAAYPMTDTRLRERLAHMLAAAGL